MSRQHAFSAVNLMVSFRCCRYIHRKMGLLPRSDTTVKGRRGEVRIPAFSEIQGNTPLTEAAVATLKRRPL
ncbi:hypothetical protein GE061_003284 [Apolygus lucorum]|uniref:Uncharacterized protein n=1 Tax=Apolygus lucorum TaxID=248454 RepID=A0A8S9X3D3_APOLU|nr:hypothetical protein GE061_003284 [Apolygus lucorum]